MQLLITSIPAFLFPLVYGSPVGLWKTHDHLFSMERFRTNMMMVCMLSVFLCYLFQSDLWDGVIINFALFPIVITILYAKYWEGLVLIVFQIVLYTFFTEQFSITGLLLETAILIYPIVLICSVRFKKENPLVKFVWTLVFFVLAQGLYVGAQYMNATDQLHLMYFLVIFIEVPIIALVAGLFIYMIESTLEREKLRLQVTLMSYESGKEALKLQQMMDAAPICIILLDNDNRIISINDTFLKLYRKDFPNITMDEIIGLNISEFLRRSKLDPSQIMRSCGSEKMSQFIQIGLETYLTSVTPITKGTSNENMGSIIMIQDMTELETLKLELSHVERLGVIGQMAAGITHEIRNPMAVVRGFLQLMREKSSDNLDHYYRIVLDELDRANSIINDFLALAQNKTEQKEESRLHDIIHELTPLLWADANLRGQSIEVDLDYKVPVLMLNPKEIKQLILNLCRNAMEAMDDKGQLTIMTHVVENGVELHVSDTGPGISPEEQVKLFQPFYTTKTKGTGLGLALCQSILEKHGGNISVKSELGVGTTFVVLLPIPSEQLLQQQA
nr:ATP-binding protein [Paenibacillus turicensis]